MENPVLTARSLALLARSGVLAPMRPDRAARAANVLLRYGMSIASGYAVGARRHPDRIAIVDDRGVLTYSDVDDRTDRLAAALLGLGMTSGSTVALLCRNHRGPVEAATACAKIGAHVVLLNTGLSADQLRDVVAEQAVDLLVSDEEFAQTLADVPDPGRQGPLRVLGWTDSPGLGPSLESLTELGGDVPLPMHPPTGRLIVLTSGTTGTPKGARRPSPKGLGPAGALLSRIPLQAGTRTLISAPLFHAWGFAGLQISFLLGAPLVLARRFDPVTTLALIEEHRVCNMFAVPVMLQRVLELPDEELARYDTSSLRVVAASGSALTAGLSERFMDRFGPVLYNLYGSTEVSWVSIADPGDIRLAPGTVGRAPLGTVLRILDDGDRPTPPGATGRIFVGNDMMFDGYTRAGASVPAVGGLLGTGDVGHLDEHGLLHVTGRSDDMIVSGGENVHPGQVEELISSWAEVREVAVVGVPDEHYGQRLAAFLVVAPGSDLDADTVRTRVKQRLARFAVPRDVEFLDELPRNATGKVVKARLRHP